MIADAWCPWCRDHQRAELTADRAALRRELDALRQTHAGDLARERARVEAAERECAGVRAALADNDLILEERERQLTAALADAAGLRAAHARLTCAVGDRRGALESVAPERVRAYLAGHGWALRRALVMGDFPVELWAHPRRDRDAVVLTTMEPADYAARMWDVAAWCGVVEARDPLFVLAEWLAPDAATPRAGEGGADG